MVLPVYSQLCTPGSRSLPFALCWPSCLGPSRTNVACSNKYVSRSHGHPHSQPKNKAPCDLRDLRLPTVAPFSLYKSHHPGGNYLITLLLCIFIISNICMRPFATSKIPPPPVPTRRT